MTKPPLRQLHVFAQLVASGSTRECARILGISPAAIETEIEALEEQLGHQLFAMNGDVMELTAVGWKTVEALQVLTIHDFQDEDDAEGTGAPAPAESESAPIADAVDEPPISVDSALPEPDPLDLQEPGLDSAPVEGGSDDQPAAIDVPAPELAPEPIAPPKLTVRSIAARLEFTSISPARMPMPIVVTPIMPATTQAEAETAVSETVEIEDVGIEDEAADEELLLTEPLSLDAPEAIPVEPALVEPDPEPDVEEAPDAFDELLLDAGNDRYEPAPTPHEDVLELETALPSDEDDCDASLQTETAPEPEPEPESAPVDEPVLELVPDTRQKVVVAAHPSIFGHFRESLTAFEQANPDVAITLDLEALTAIRAEPMLARGEADIIYYYAMSDFDRLESRYVWSESVSLFIGADHPLAVRDEVTGDDLMMIRAILLGPRNGLRPILDNALRRGGIDLWHPVLESDDLTEIEAAVREGRGFFGAFGPLARDFGKSQGIKRLPFIDPLPPVEVRQAVRPAMMDDPVVTALAEFLFQ
jgi:DNA-binding transcriptional LysR family regulator